MGIAWLGCKVDMQKVRRACNNIQVVAAVQRVRQNSTHKVVRRGVRQMQKDGMRELCANTEKDVREEEILQWLYVKQVFSIGIENDRCQDLVFAHCFYLKNWRDNWQALSFDCELEMFSGSSPSRRLSSWSSLTTTTNLPTLMLKHPCLGMATEMSWYMDHLCWTINSSSRRTTSSILPPLSLISRICRSVLGRMIISDQIHRSIAQNLQWNFFTRTKTSRSRIFPRIHRT